MAEEVPMEEVLTVGVVPAAATPAAADILVSRAAEILIAALAAGGTREAEALVAGRFQGRAQGRAQGQEDFLLVRPGVSRAVHHLDAEVSGRPQPRAISAAPERGNPWRVAPAATTAGGFRLEIRAGGRCRRRLTAWGTQWAADGIPLGA